MAIRVILEATARPGTGADLLATFASIMPDTRAYDGCGGVEVLRNQDDPDNLVLVETWESRAHYEKYLAWRREAGTSDRLYRAVMGRPTIRFFDATDA